MIPTQYISKSEIDPEQWQESAALILEAIPNAILAKLGVPFNTLFYQSMADHECACAFLAHSPSGKSLGIIIGTLNRSRVYAATMKNNVFRLLLAANVRLVRSAVILWVLKGVWSKFQRAKRDAISTRPAAEMIVIAVDPDARGTGVAAQLVSRMETWMTSKGLDGPYTILTEKSNGRSNSFYAKIGSHFVGTTLHHGREINEWHKYPSQE
jgi:ribosomal protein S18 acetylase RimI-like enzyme